MLFLGIDLGTSSVKIIAMNEEGHILGEASREYSVHYPKQNWAEQDPEDWWIATRDCIKELSSKEFCINNTIKGIGLSGQMHGLVVLDENNQVLHPAIIWCDQRTDEECNDILDSFGQEKLSEYTGNRVLTGFTLPKLLWIKKHKPKIFKKIAHILLPKDYIRFKLTGDYATDLSDASGMLMLDVRNRCWSKEIVNFIEIDELALPKLYQSYEVTGYVSDAMSDILGLKGKIEVVAGAGDQAAGAIGTGTVKKGIVSVTLGTSGVVFAAHDDYTVDKENRLHAFCHANGKYHSMGVMLSAASCLNWWIKEVNKGVSFDVLLKEAEDVPLGSNGLIFLPYLMGERTPYPDPNARGCFIGLSMSHMRGHMTRAILEGVAFGLKDSIEILKDLKMPIDTVRLVGGGSKSILWNQIIADVFNEKIEILKTNQGGALGASILASVGCQLYENVEEACDNIVSIREIFYPKKINAEEYYHYYMIYKDCYKGLKSIFNSIAKL